ncbi:hypothetical protein MT418_008182 [Batrachochytrium dendrobatidis]
MENDLSLGDLRQLTFRYPFFSIKIRCYTRAKPKEGGRFAELDSPKGVRADSRRSCRVPEGRVPT